VRVDRDIEQTDYGRPAAVRICALIARA